MKTYKEMSDNVIKRSEIIIEKKKMKKKQIIKGIGMMLGVCILLSNELIDNAKEKKIIGESEIDSSLYDNNYPQKDVVKPEESQIIWLASNGDEDENELEIWYDKRIKDSLAEALNKEEADVYFAIEICNKNADKFFYELQHIMYENNIYSEYKLENNTFIIFITKKSFKELSFDKVMECTFGLAEKGK